MAASCLAAMVFWADFGAAGPLLTPLRVLGKSGFHHASSVSEIVVLSDGEHFLSSSRDGSARLWEMRTGREIRRFLRPASNDMWGILVLPGEEELLTAGGGGYVTRWELATGKQLKTYKHESTVFRLALRPGGREFVATDHKNVAILWNLETGEKLRTFKGHTDSVYTAMFVSEGKRLLTGASDGKLKMWDVETGKCERTFEEDLDDVYTIQPSPDGKRFAVCSADDKLRVFEAERLEVVWKRDFDDDIKVACWSPDGEKIATACEDRHLHVLDARTGKRLHKIRVPHGYHTPISFTTDGKELISGGDSRLYRHEIETGKRIVPPAGDPPVRGGVEAIALSGSGERVYAAGDDAVIQVWDTASGREVQRFELEHAVRTMAVSPDGGTVATGSSDGVVRLRSAASGELIRQLASEGSIEKVLFAGRGARLLSAGSDDKVHYWETATGKKLRTFAGHTNDVNAVAVSPDGRMLVTASDDQTVRLWELETGKTLRTFGGIDDNLYGAAVLQDGKSFLITAKEPELWGWVAPAPAREANLSRDEIGRLVGELAAEKFSQRDAATKALIARGPAVLPLLEPMKPEDPEAAFRLRQIKSKIRTAQYDGELKTLHEFEDDLTSILGDPSGRYWVATVGWEADAKVVIGEVRNRELHVLQEYSDGHAPGELAFSADGSLLAAGNRDGSVSLFRVGPEKEGR